MTPECKDMSKYATKAMIGWSIIIISMVVSGGFTLTSKHVESVMKSNSKIYASMNESQNRQAEKREFKIEKLQNKQEQDHEMIKNVESRLNGIETALEFLVDRAKGMR